MVMGAASTGGITKVNLGAAGPEAWHRVSGIDFVLNVDQAQIWVNGAFHFFSLPIYFSTNYVAGGGICKLVIGQRQYSYICTTLYM